MLSFPTTPNASHPNSLPHPRQTISPHWVGPHCGNFSSSSQGYSNRSLISRWDGVPEGRGSSRCLCHSGKLVFPCCWLWSGRSVQSTCSDKGQPDCFFKRVYVSVFKKEKFMLDTLKKIISIIKMNTNVFFLALGY